MSLEELADLATIIVASFVVLGALPALYMVSQGAWRWRLGGWAAAVYSIWYFAYHDRDRSSESLWRRLLWGYRWAATLPLALLSRLASSRLQKTIYAGVVSKEEIQAVADQKELEAIEQAEHHTLLAYLRIQAREESRRHRPVGCSVCGRKGRLMRCGEGCREATDPKTVFHLCFNCELKEANGIQSFNPFRKM